MVCARESDKSPDPAILVGSGSVYSKIESEFGLFQRVRKNKKNK